MTSFADIFAQVVMFCERSIAERIQKNDWDGALRAFAMTKNVELKHLTRTAATT